jgi:YggT family protein
MFVASNFLTAVGQILDMVLHLYMWAIIINAVLSWVNPDPYNPIVRMLYQITEPSLRLVRRYVPIGGIGIDISPIIVILVIMFLRNFLVRTIIQFGLNLH